eukprot:NODE_690_length_4708_cov_1.164895.p4 type:complete len:271 gc:universal NODE_690_length_4708_cov_1.164895:3626-2814(-)
MSEASQVIEEGPIFLAILILNWIVSVSSLTYSTLTWKTSNYNKFNAFAVLQFMFSSFGDLLLIISMPLYAMNWLIASTSLVWSVGILCQDTSTFINNILLAYRLRVFKQVANIPNWVEKSLYSFIVLIYVALALVSNFLLFGVGVSLLGLLLHVGFYFLYLVNSIGISITSVILILKFNSQASKYQGSAGNETANFKKRETMKVISVLAIGSFLLIVIGISNVFLVSVFPLMDSISGLALRIVFMLHLWYNTVIKKIVGGKKKSESANKP